MPAVRCFQDQVCSAASSQVTINCLQPSPLSSGCSQALMARSGSTISPSPISSRQSSPRLSKILKPLTLTWTQCHQKGSQRYVEHSSGAFQVDIVKMRHHEVKPARDAQAFRLTKPLALWFAAVLRSNNHSCLLAGSFERPRGSPAKCTSGLPRRSVRRLKRSTKRYASQMS